MDTNGKFLATLTQSLEVLHEQGASITTTDFVQTIDKILPVFDYLGPVFMFAKNEMLTKKDTLLKACPDYPILSKLVDADKKAGTVTTKNSCSRNLHRLASVIAFVQMLLQKLSENSAITLREAATIAYEEVLAPFHTFVVRGAVRAGLLTLPTREHFLKCLDETEETVKAHTDTFIASAQSVTVEVKKMYDCDMPVSNVWFYGS